MAFKGVGLYDAVFSSTSPELACEGSFRKCFRKEAETGEWRSDIFIYKRGSEGFSNAGLEPYCEVLSSEIAQIICPNAVSYELTRLHGKLASRCNLFTNEKYGYVSFAKLADVKKMNFEDMFYYFIEHGAEQQFREMIVLDAVCFNEDRHAGNFGMMFNNDTMELVKMSPIFDLNISLLAHVKDDELSNVGDILYARTPVFGDDFTRMGQIACNDIIRERVKDIKDFTFKFRGNNTFSPERVHILENIVRKQAEAILSTDKLFTKDVFISQKELEFTKLKKASNEAFLLMEAFETKIREPLSQMDYLTSRCGKIGNVQCFVKNSEGSFEMAIDFLNGSISIRLNDWIITPEKLKEKLPQKYTIYQKTINELQAFMREKQDERFNLSAPSFREICEAAQEKFYNGNGYYPTSEEAVRLTDEAKEEIAREKEE